MQPCCRDEVWLTPSSAGIVEVTSRTWDILTLDEAKDELGIVDTGDSEIDTKTDARVQGLIETVHQWCETTVYKTYGSATVRRVSFWAWPANGVLFESPPLLSVDEVGYIDEDGNPQVLPTDQYVVTVKQVGRGWLTWSSEFEAPALTEVDGPKVTIDYTSGATSVPPIVDRAARIMLSRYWDNHNDVAVLENYDKAAIGLMRDAESWGDYA